MSFQKGDRVRITNPNSEYTGCRGTISDGDESAPAGVTVLGHQVAIDGENGVARPFLLTDLEPLRAVRAGARRTIASQPAPVEAKPSTD